MDCEVFLKGDVNAKNAEGRKISQSYFYVSLLCVYILYIKPVKNNLYPRIQQKNCGSLVQLRRVSFPLLHSLRDNHFAFCSKVNCNADLCLKLTGLQERFKQLVI